jgi:chitodextrinase
MSSGARISRKKFLKLIGAGGTAIFLGWLAQDNLLSVLQKYGNNNNNNNDNNSQIQEAYAQGSSGSWLPVTSSTSAVAIHSALTSAGKILYLAGSGWDLNRRNGPYLARLLDPVTGTDTNVPLSKDLFCAGQCQLPNGNILLTGGIALYDADINNCNGRWHGARFAYEFDVNTGTLVEQAPMKTGRWYPTLVTLADGKVIVVSGLDDYGSYNYLAEMYDPVTKSWSISYDPFSSNSYCVGFDATGGCPGAGSPCFGGPNQGVAPWLALYPRMFLMPTGLIYASSMREQLFLLDPSTGMWTHIGQSSLGQFRDYGTSILLPLQNSSSERGKVMVVGGSSTDISPATNVVEIHDFNQGTATNPSIRRVGSLNTGRKFLLPIVLPNGKVAVFGGSSQGNNNPVFVPEMFDPENENQGWVQLPAATVPRHYHGTALLLPDGSVWTAGGTPNAAVWELRIEIFRPSYFFSASPRPTISANPTVGDYGASITIPTPDAANISRVSLVKTGCTTHHYDTDMRLVWLPITSRTSNSVIVSAPINANIAPPGHYMIHVLDSSLVPSTARIIKIPGTGSGGGGGDTTPPAQVAGLSATTVSSTQINLGWTANTETDLNHYNVYRGTTAGFVVTPGTTVPIATPTTNSYSNTGLSPSTTYYYKVAAVDNAGNIGAVSAERSATTSPAADTTPPTVTITSPINNARVPAGNLIVSGTSQDNVGGTGVNNVAVQLDGGAFVTATGTTNWSITINITKKGAHQLRARAQDNAGNSGFSSTVKINIQ